MNSHSLREQRSTFPFNDPLRMMHLHPQFGSPGSAGELAHPEELRPYCIRYIYHISNLMRTNTPLQPPSIRLIASAPIALMFTPSSSL